VFKPYKALEGNIEINTGTEYDPAMAAGITDHIWEPMDLVLWMEQVT